MGDETILVLGQRPDVHIDTVVQKLESLNRKVVVFDRWEASQGITLDFCHGTLAGTIHTDREEIGVGEIGAVWWRVKPVRNADFGLTEGKLGDAFIRREWMEVFLSLSDLLPDIPWINTVSRHYRAAHKPSQLALASKVGLKYPPTIITNHSDSVLDGFDPSVQLIYKTLSSFVLPPDEIIFTNEVERNQIANAKAEIAMAPCIFQRKLEKQYELRITVVGEQMFTVGIDSQNQGATEIDWRRDQSRQMYFEARLSPETEKQLRNFHHRAKLEFATYDFVVTPEGEEFFLECNPGGQWLWLEQALDLEISDSVASLLAAKPGLNENLTINN